MTSFAYKDMKCGLVCHLKFLTVKIKKTKNEYYDTCKIQSQAIRQIF